MSATTDQVPLDATPAEPDLALLREAERDPEHKWTGVTGTQPERHTSTSKSMRRMSQSIPMSKAQTNDTDDSAIRQWLTSRGRESVLATGVDVCTVVDEFCQAREAHGWSRDYANLSYGLGRQRRSAAEDLAFTEFGMREAKVAQGSSQSSFGVGTNAATLLCEWIAKRIQCGWSANYGELEKSDPEMAASQRDTAEERATTELTLKYPKVVRIPRSSLASSAFLKQFLNSLGLGEYSQEFIDKGFKSVMILRQGFDDSNVRDTMQSIMKGKHFLKLEKQIALQRIALTD